MSLPALRTLGFKGLCFEGQLAEVLALSPAAAADLLRQLEKEGLAEATARGFRLTPDGRSQLDRRLSEERKSLESSILASSYEEFLKSNSTFKQIVTDYQTAADDLRTQDRALKRLRRIHSGVLEVVAQAQRALPRLEGYSARFVRALSSVEAGDARFWASPLVDSYHSIWFELHEELLQARGLSRAEEAAAGRAD